MVIDTSTYTGHWPFRKISNSTICKLSRHMEKCDITHALVSNINAIFYRDVNQGNYELYEELKAYSGLVQFLPFAIINPTYPAWEKDAEYAIDKLGFKGIELAPNYHGYSLAAEGAMAFRLAGELKVPVRILSGFEDIRQRNRLDTFTKISYDEIADMFEASPNTTLILNSFDNLYNLGGRFEKLVRENSNIYFDINRLDTFVRQQWERTIKAIGINNLCFGTRAPLLYIEPSLNTIVFAPATDEERKRVLYKNIRGVFGL